MKTLIKYLLVFVATFVVNAAWAQNAEMADTFRSEGKIYVVVAVILIVLLGLFTYLFLLDRKITRLERMMGEKTQTKREGKSL